MITTANDVIHAFAVPQFGIKQDAIPGFVRDTWFRAEKIGVYRGQCQELCGAEHAYMPINVKVVSAEDYTKWVDGKKKEMSALLDDPTKTYTVAELTSRGEKVYVANCAVCHQPAGNGNPALGAPALVGDAKVMGAKDAQIAVLLHGAEQQQDAGLEPVDRRRDRLGDQLHAKRLDQRRQGHRPGRSAGRYRVGPQDQGLKRERTDCAHGPDRSGAWRAP